MRPRPGRLRVAPPHQLARQGGAASRSNTPSRHYLLAIKTRRCPRSRKTRPRKHRVQPRRMVSFSSRNPTMPMSRTWLTMTSTSRKNGSQKVVAGRPVFSMHFSRVLCLSSSHVARAQYDEGNYERRLMRSLAITAQLLVAGGGYVFAEVAVPPRPEASSERPSRTSTEKSAHEVAVANCVQMWDRGTHMTEQQWLRTCRRVQDRLKQIQARWPGAGVLQGNPERSRQQRSALPWVFHQSHSPHTKP
jgi:hypothetical protein